MLKEDGLYFAEAMVELEERVMNIPTCIHITRGKDGKQGTPQFYDFCQFCDLIVRFNDRIIVNEKGHICDLSGERISYYSCDSKCGTLKFDGEYDTYVVYPFETAISVFPDAIVNAAIENSWNDDVMLYLSANNLVARNKSDMEDEIEDCLVSPMSNAEAATRISMFCGCLFSDVLDTIERLHSYELSLSAAKEEIIWNINH